MADGHHRAVSLATSGHINWPPVGRNYWPLTTEHPTAEGKLYLSAVKDVYSGRIVGYSMDARMKSSLAVAALENAVRARRPAATVVHSDRGSQFLFPSLRRITAAPRAHRIDGQGRCVCRQRRDGIVLLAAAKECPGPSAVAHQAGPPAGYHELDRADLSPPATAKTAGKTHANRI